MQVLLHGKEIYLFFGKYGKNGIIGLIISQILIGLIIYKVLKIARKSKLENYSELTDYINQNKKTNEILKKIINIFLLLSFYVMVAGFSAYFSQELGTPSIIGTIIIIILCYKIFMGNIEGIIKVNMILIPILIGLIVILIGKNMDAYQNIGQKAIENNLLKSIYSGIIYSSYNSITLIPILIPLKKYIKTDKQTKQIAIIIVITLIIVALAIYGLLLKVDIDINKIDLPTVYVAGMSGRIYKYIYGGIILLAIFTSSISAGYSLLKNYEKDPKRYKKMAIILVLSAIPVSKVGFTTLINLLYPIFGILGSVQIVKIFIFK